MKGLVKACLVVAISAVAPQVQAGDPYTAATVAGSYAFRIEDQASATRRSFLTMGIGAIVLHEDGTITGRRFYYGTMTRGATAPATPVLEDHDTSPIEQALSGTFTIDADGIGTADILVSDPRVLEIATIGNGCTYAAHAIEPVRFVASNGGCRLDIVQLATSDLGPPCAIGPITLRMEGFAVRQDAECACGQGASPAMLAPLPSLPRRSQ